MSVGGSLFDPRFRSRFHPCCCCCRCSVCLYRALCICVCYYMPYSYFVIFLISGIIEQQSNNSPETLIPSDFMTFPILLPPLLLYRCQATDHGVATQKFFPRLKKVRQFRATATGLSNRVLLFCVALRFSCFSKFSPPVVRNGNLHPLGNSGPTVRTATFVTGHEL